MYVKLDRLMILGIETFIRNNTKTKTLIIRQICHIALSVLVNSGITNDMEGRKMGVVVSIEKFRKVNLSF